MHDRYDGVLPRTYDELTALPGIGDYTASAVLSFAYGQRIAVIDTNIRRVLSRAFLGVESLGGTASAVERDLARRLLPGAGDGMDGAGDTDASARSVIWNQAVMELGATVCTAKTPLCDNCPIAGECAFLAAGRPGLGERRTRPRQRFAGTDRQVRGIVLDALRALPAGGILPRERVDALWHDPAQLGRCVASLDEDGLIDIVGDGAVRLPA